MNIVYCGNKQVFDGILSSLISIANKTNEVIHCYVMTMDLSFIDHNYKALSIEDIKFIEYVLKQKNKHHFVKRIDVTQLYLDKLGGCINELSFYTPYSLLRLLIDCVFDEDKLLYLDVDVMAQGDLLNLYKINIDHYEYAGVKDRYGSIFLHRDYINSGVLLMNMKKIKETGLLHKARKCVRTKKYSFPDQDALYESTTKKLILERRYNEQASFRRKETLLCHFARRFWLLPYPHRENYKQWHIKEVHRYLRCYCFDEDLKEYLIWKEIYFKESGYER